MPFGEIVCSKTLSLSCIKRTAALLALATLLALAGLGRACTDSADTPDTGGVRLHTGRPGTRHIIALDAGHGGMDTGARGLVDEVEVIQPTTDALYALLEADPAYAPVLVHTPQEELRPKQRADVAAQANAALFLSLHANKDSSASSNGFECYAIPPGLEHHEQSLVLAQAIAARMGQAGARIRGENGVRYAYYRGHSKVMKDSTDTAVYNVPTFGVLQHAPCPAVLIEQCFITNAADLDAWGDADGVAAAAYCYYQAICDYFGTTPLAPAA